MLAEDGKPLIGEQARMLGVRVNVDIPVQHDGTVLPLSGGLSVVPEWRSLPLFLIPRRLQARVNDARGSNRLACFRLAEVKFVETSIDGLLELRPDSHNHGTIQPSQTMPLDTYQNALAATQGRWAIDEQ